MKARVLLSRWPPLLLLLVAAVLRFWQLGAVALIGDESYYWLWSQHLAPAYLDNPAGVAFMVRLSTLVAGQSEVGIRWLNAALGVGAVALVYAIGERLFSPSAAIVSAALLAVGAPYLVISRFVYTDALQLFLLLLNLYLLIPLRTRSPGIREAAIATWRFWAVGLSLAALLNTKYNAYLYALSVVVLLVWTRRELLADRRTWVAASVACCGLLPVLWWNAAHGWASFRWQYAHFVSGALPQERFFASLRMTASLSTLARNAWHIFTYLTPPLALLAVLGVVQVRGSGRRMLLVPAAVLTLPIVLSPASSPRNLTVGVVLLLVLAADAICHELNAEGEKGKRERQPRVARERGMRRGVVMGVLVVLVAGAALFGLGTVVETWHPTALPHSPAATQIRQDSAGWRMAGERVRRLGLDPGVTLFAIDYDVAAQLRYYTGLPAHTSWGQYQLWGTPELDQVRIVALPYIDPAIVSERLRLTFREVEGPGEWRVASGELDRQAKVLYTWMARGCLVDVEIFLHRFDLIELARAGTDGK